MCQSLTTLFLINFTVIMNMTKNPGAPRNPPQGRDLWIGGALFYLSSITKLWQILGERHRLRGTYICLTGKERQASKISQHYGKVERGAVRMYKIIREIEELYSTGIVSLSGLLDHSFHRRRNDIIDFGGSLSLSENWDNDNIMVLSLSVSGSLKLGIDNRIFASFKV